MSASFSPLPIPSSNLTANSIASIRLKYAVSSAGRAPGRHLRRLAGDARDRVDRVAEEVAVVDLRPAAQLAHRVAQLGLDERVDDHCGPALGAVHGEREVVHVLDARVAHLLERLLGELRLEREHEPGRRLAGGVRDDVQLDRGRGAHRAEAIAATVAPVSRTRSRGSSSSSRPRLPALTKTVSCPSAEASTTVGSRRRWPSGEIPPVT